MSFLLFNLSDRTNSFSVIGRPVVRSSVIDKSSFSSQRKCKVNKGTMDPDFFFRHLRERLNPHLLHYLINTRHSIGIWGLQDLNGHRFVGNLLVLYDDADLLTVVWEQGSFDSRGLRQHYHMCPDALRSYWHLLALTGQPNPAPHLLTFSRRPESPFPCPQLFLLRSRLDLWRAHPDHSCMLPGPTPADLPPAGPPAPRPYLAGQPPTGPSFVGQLPVRLHPSLSSRANDRIRGLGLSPAFVNPRPPYQPPLTSRIRGLVLPPMIRHQLQLSAAALEAPDLFARLARGPPAPSSGQPMDLSPAAAPSNDPGTNDRLYC